MKRFIFPQHSLISIVAIFLIESYFPHEHLVEGALLVEGAPICIFEILLKFLSCHVLNEKSQSSSDFQYKMMDMIINEDIE